MSGAPLEGIRVVDLAAYIAGAYCTSLLADMGAEVLKVEPPWGDPFRQMAVAFQGWNRGKRSIALDLTRPEGREVLLRLVERADVVVENYRTGVPERLGVDYNSLCRVNPRLVYCSISGYGRRGPYAGKPAFDPLFQAQSGAMQAQGAGGDPVFLQVAISDYASALLGAWGVLLALFHRARTGEGQLVEASLLKGAVALQAGEFLFYRGREEAPAADPLGPGPLRRLYRTADGWLALSAEGRWGPLCRALGLEGLQADPRFATEGARRTNAAALTALLEGLFLRRGVGAWLVALQGAGVPCAPVPLPHQALLDPQVQAWGLATEHLSADVGPVVQVGVMARLSATPWRPQGPAPALGQHTDEILREIGYSEGEVQRLRAGRVVL